MGATPVLIHDVEEVAGIFDERARRPIYGLRMVRRRSTTDGGNVALLIRLPMTIARLRACGTP